MPTIVTTREHVLCACMKDYIPEESFEVKDIARNRAELPNRGGRHVLANDEDFILRVFIPFWCMPVGLTLHVNTVLIDIIYYI